MKVYIWGTGDNAKKLIREGALKVDVEGYIESIPTKDMFNGKKVFSASDEFEYDAIIATCFIVS